MWGTAFGAVSTTPTTPAVVPAVITTSTATCSPPTSKSSYEEQEPAASPQTSEYYNPPKDVKSEDCPSSIDSYNQHLHSGFSGSAAVQEQQQHQLQQHHFVKRPEGSANYSPTSSGISNCSSTSPYPYNGVSSSFYEPYSTALSSSFPTTAKSMVKLGAKTAKNSNNNCTAGKKICGRFLVMVLC
jgi:hypothetical protein